MPARTQILFLCVSVGNMRGRFIHNVTGNQHVHLCMSQRHTLFIIALSDTQRKLSVFGKLEDAITQNHSCALSLWHQHTTCPCSDPRDRRAGRLDIRRYKQQREQQQWRAGRKQLCYSLSSSLNYPKISFSGVVTLSKYSSVATDV